MNTKYLYAIRETRFEQLIAFGLVGLLLGLILLGVNETVEIVTKQKIPDFSVTLDSIVWVVLIVLKLVLIKLLTKQFINKNKQIESILNDNIIKENTVVIKLESDKKGNRIVLANNERKVMYATKKMIEGLKVGDSCNVEYVEGCKYILDIAKN